MAPEAQGHRACATKLPYTGANRIRFEGCLSAGLYCRHPRFQVGYLNRKAGCRPLRGCEAAPLALQGVKGEKEERGFSATSCLFTPYSER